MNYTLILMVLGFAITGIAAILQYRENDKLQTDLLNFTRGDDKSVPGLISIGGLEKVSFSIRNNDVVPIFNVKVKCNEDVLPDLGTIYPNVNQQFYTLNVPLSDDSVSFNFVIWYNNRNSIEVFISLKRDSQSKYLTNNIVVYTKNNQVFRHPWHH